MKDNKIFGIVGLILGVIICIFGFIILSNVSNTNTNTDHPESASFGADFYTYQYKVTKSVAENTEIVAKLAEVIATGIGYLLLAIGGTDILLFGNLLMKKPVQNLDRNGTTIVKIEADQSEELLKILKETKSGQANATYSSVRDELPPL